MKQFFEEPKLCLEQFSVIDQTTVSCFVTADKTDDEMNAHGIKPITEG